MSRINEEGYDGKMTRESEERFGRKSRRIMRIPKRDTAIIALFTIMMVLMIIRVYNIFNCLPETLLKCESECNKYQRQYYEWYSGTCICWNQKYDFSGFLIKYMGMNEPKKFDRIEMDMYC